MSLSNVLKLTGVYAKSSRLITRRNFRKYVERHLGTYALYALAVGIGVLGGLGFGFLYQSVPDARATFKLAAFGFFVSLPTFSVLYTLFLTMMFQIQRSGVKASVQPIYWFPVTWREHTAASVLSSMLTGSLWIALLLCAGTLTVSIFMGTLPVAILASLGLLLCIVMTSVTAEILKALISGFSGKFFKVAGKSAIWLRFFSTILLFTVAYAAYFAFTQSSTVAFTYVSQGQLSVWFVPYVWPGIAVYAFGAGAWLTAALFVLGSIIFTIVIFAVAVWLNARYAFSEAVAIRVSSEYKAGSGLPGVSPAVWAIVKKDFKAFTRRSELMYVFIAPIVMVVATFMPMLTGSGSRSGNMRDLLGAQSFYYVYLAIFPAAFLALMLGTSMVGMEGDRLWVLVASPASIKNFVRAKFLFPAILSIPLSLAFCGVGYVLFHPSPRLAATGAIEAILVVLAFAAISLSCGVIGADFREAPRPRMIRMEWRLTCMLMCAAAGLVIVLPVLVYGFSDLLSRIMPSYGANGAYLYAAWLISAALALAIAYVSYGIAAKQAEKLLGAQE